MKSVHELSVEEIEELRERYIIEFDLDHDRISDEEVRQYYAGTYFVNDDFSCNLTDDEEEEE
jgi:phosphoribosylformylglycinamidine (FGAM) synthase PurS component